MPIPLPVIANVYRVSLNWVESASGQHAANILHFQRALGTAADVFADLVAHFAVNMWYSTSAGAKIATVDIIKLDGVSGRITYTPTTANFVGQATSGDFIPNASYLVKFGTGLRGRNRRGRIYLPFLTEGQAASGQLNTAAIAALNTAWSGFLAAMVAAADFPVVASYDRKHAGAGASATLINSMAPELTLGTQRRRQSRLR